MRNKVILTFVVAIFTTVMLNVQNVFGVGIVSQSWTEDIDEDGKNDLIFRTYTNPHRSTIETYQETRSTDYVVEGNKTWEYIDTNGNRQTSKWIITYNDETNILPTNLTFRTIGLKFHISPLSTYGTLSNSSSGKRFGYNETSATLTDQISSITNAYTTSTAKYTNTLAEVSSPSIFYEIKHYSGNFTNIDWGTGLKVTGLNIQRNREYRYAIVEINGSNVYVSDTVIYDDDLAAIVKEAKRLGSPKGCYVSDIVASRTHHESGGYEVAHTAYDFFRQIDKCVVDSSGNIEHFWSSDTHGLNVSDKSMSSILNLFDNKLIFPQSAKRTVLVKHINLGDTTKVTRQTVANGTSISSTNVSLTAYNSQGEKTVTGTKSSIQYTGYQEYYEAMLDVDQGLKKTALSSNDEYQYIGYNVGKATSRSSAQNYINTRLDVQLYNSGTQVDVAPDDTATNDEFIIIEFYYSNTPKEVYANHIYVDNVGQVLAMSKQTIQPNRTATAGNTTLNRINNDTYISEVYTQPVGSNVQVKTVAGISNYVGYQLFTSVQDVEDIIGKKVNLSTLNKGTSVNLSAKGNMQVNFYYKILRREQLVPDVGGRLFVNPASGQINTVCVDTNGNNYGITSIPSGSKATVGVSGIPKYMMAAITDNYILQDNTIDMTFTFKLGNSTKTVNFNDIKYSLGYYKITDMAIYKLNDVTVYDAGTDGTIGTSIFNWNQDKLNATPTISNLSVALTGIKGAINATSPTAINDISNYSSANLSYSYTNSSGSKVSKSSSMTGKNSYSDTITYLTAEQLNEVDADGDGKVTTSDSAAVDAKINEYTKLTSESIIALQIAQGEYDRAIEELKSVTESLEDLIKQRDEYEEQCEQCKDMGGYCAMPCDLYTYTSNKIKKYEDVEAAEKALAEAQENYDRLANEVAEFREYMLNFDKKYDSYKAAYDEYASISTSNAKTTAKAIGLKINLSVQNVDVKLNNSNILQYSSGGASASGTLDLSTSNSITVKTKEPTINKNLYTNIQSTTIGESEYKNESSINASVLNGIRALAGQAKYNTQVLIGNKNVADIEDNVYYKSEKAIFNVGTTTITKNYKADVRATTSTDKYKQVEPINIYTPITVSATLETENNRGYVQINKSFTIKLSNTAPDSKYGVSNTTKYSMGYYVKFDFDVNKVSINGKTYKNGQKIPAGTWIGLISGASGEQSYITASIYDQIGDENNGYTVRAVSYNATDLMLSKSTRYERLEDMKSNNSDMKELIYNICNDTSYFAETTGKIIIKGVIYDFKVTDLKDLNWKNIFRINTSNTTNSHTSNVYHAGTRKWDITSDTENNMVNRSSSEIGKNPLRILPLGPYKNTDTTYIKAPKLGYRFSYDLKVMGYKYYDSNTKPIEDNKVTITTNFYYISKDGKTFLQEYNGGTGNGIYLFYKNNSGKYVRIDQNGGGYNLTFTPNDGYRYIEDSDTSTLSSKSISLGNIRTSTLTHQMATLSDDGAVITYYGEYKLPNSTIAVKVENGKYNINKPLEDGYIGVVFNITAQNSNSNIAPSYEENTSGINTSQWDYEGFLGYSKAGQALSKNSLQLKLEKGTWNITNSIYNKIKGSVILYDIDQRAATDYE